MYLSGKGMRVIHFNDFRSYAGAETAIRMLRESQRKMEIQTFLFTKEEIGLHFSPLTIKKLRCRRIFKEIKPDLIHIHNTVEIGLAPIITALKEEIPVVWTLHDYKGICPNTLLLRPNNTICRDRDCSSCDPDKMIIHFNYHDLYKLLKDVKCVVASDYVKKRYQGVIDATRVYWDADPSLLKLKVKSSFKSRDILFGGRRDYEKGVLYAILALKRLVKKYPKAKLIFAGESRGENIEQLSKIYRVEKNIVDLGYLSRENYLKVLQDVNCVICPSIWEEPFNLSLLEAMAAGKPVVATRIGGQTEVVRDAGILIEPKSSIDICQAIDALFSDKKLHSELSRRSRERARKFRNCGKEYKKVYDSLIAQRL